MSGIVMADSFDHYTTVLEKNNATILSGAGSTAGISVAAGRNSTSGLRLTGSSASGGSVAAVTRTMPAQLGTGWYAFAFQCSSLPNSLSNDANLIFCLRDAGTIQISVALLADGTMKIYRGGTINSGSTTVLAGPTSWSILPATKYHFELKAVINTGTGGSIILRRNASSADELNVSGLNTRVSSNNYATEIVYGNIPRNGTASGGFNASTSHDFDDMVVRDDQFSGDVQVKTMLANAAGTYSEWSPNPVGDNYQKINESAPDDDTSYVATSTLNARDTYLYPGVAVGSTVHGVIPYFWAKKTDAGDASLARLIRSGGADYVGGNLNPSLQSYAYLWEVVMTDPATGVAWTDSGVNNAEFGQKRTV